MPPKETNGDWLSGGVGKLYIGTPSGGFVPDVRGGVRMREVIIKDGESMVTIRPFNIDWENDIEGPTRVHIYGMVSDVRSITDQLKGKAKCGPEVKRVIYNGPATVVLWADGTKTVVRCQPGDVFDRRIGFLTALAKKVYGGGGRFNDIIRKATEEG